MSEATKPLERRNMSIVLMDFHAQTVQESLKEMLKIPGVEDAKSKFWASKISVYGEATVEELEKQVPLRTLKWLQKNLGGRLRKRLKRQKYISC